MTFCRDGRQLCVIGAVTLAKYSTPSRTDAIAMLTQYGLALDSIDRLPGGMANSSFIVRSRGDDLVLTVLDNHDQQTAADLVRLIDYLVEAGVPTPRPLRAADGQTLLRWSGHPVILKPYIGGRLLDPTPFDVLPRVGGILAAIHAVRPPTGLREGGRRLPPDWQSTLATHPCPALEDEIHAAYRGIDPDEWERLPRGLVHGDLFGDNMLLLDDGSIVVLDWETATVEPFVLDIAMTIVAICRVDAKLDRRRVVKLLLGYEQVRSFTTTERAVLIRVVRYASAVLAYHRYVRNNIRYPDPAHSDLHCELLDFGRGLAVELRTGGAWSTDQPPGGPGSPR